MLDLQKWEIYEADVPFREDETKSKKRPVLIISPTEVLVLKLTTHGHSDKPNPLEYEISKWAEAGLETKTFIECDRYVQLGIERFTGRKYGRLQLTDIILLRQMMQFHGLTL